MRIVFIFILLFCFRSSPAQEIESPDAQLTRLVELGKIIRDNPEYKKRKNANEEFIELLTGFLQTETGFAHPLKEVNTMLSLSAKKDGFRVFTWLMRDSLFKYETHGLVAAAVRKGIVITRLKDKSDELVEAEYKTLKSDNWFGAVYYKMIPVKKGRRKTVYTLLGYFPGDPIQRKVIDVISVDRRGKPRFGDKVFYIEDFQDKKFRKPPMRLILSYSAQYSASLRWNEKKKMIIMDHLSPPDPKLKGIYDMYGPDMSYDGLEWDDDWWHLRSQVQFNSGQNIEIRPPDRPVGPPKSR